MNHESTRRMIQQTCRRRSHHRFELNVRNPPRIASCHVSSLPLLSSAGRCRQAFRSLNERVGLGAIGVALSGVCGAGLESVCEVAEVPATGLWRRLSGGIRNFVSGCCSEDG